MNIQTTYEEYARAYDCLSQEAKLYQELKGAHVESILKSTNKGSNILDFGAGTGNATLEFLLSERNVDAIDVSPDMTNILKGKCKGLDNLKIIRGDLLTLPSGEIKIYDAVNMMNVLYHLKNPLDYLKRINESTNPQGIVSVSGPHKNINIENLFYEIKNDLVQKGIFDRFKEDFETCLKVNKNSLVPNAKLYDEKELKELFNNAGFKECLRYSRGFYNGHNYFATFRK